MAGRRELWGKPRFGNGAPYGAHGAGAFDRAAHDGKQVGSR
jgi:hypothetical protein